MLLKVLSSRFRICICLVFSYIFTCNIEQSLICAYMHAQIGITTAYFGWQVVDSLHHFHGYSLPLLSPLLPSGDHPLLSPLLAPPRTTTKTLGTRTGETGGPPRTATENARRALTTSHNRLMGSQFFVPSRSCRGRVVQIHNAGQLDSIDSKLETTVLLINDYDRNFTQLLNVSRES